MPRQAITPSHTTARTPATPEGAAGEVLLRLERLTRDFGSVRAVDELDLVVRAGEVHGFLGPNGSGKSTTVSMIMSLIRPTSGRIELFGEDVARGGHRLLDRVGAIIENPAFYPYLSARDNLRAIALAAGGVPAGRVDELLALVGLSERAHSRYHTYSLGMKQRLGLASTLLTDPRLVILDEPTNGLDPAGQREVRALVPHLADEGRAVLLASHLLHEVEQVCDRVTIIRRGRLVQTGEVRTLLQHGAYLDVGLADDADAHARAATLLQDLPSIERVETRPGGLAVFADPAAGADVVRALTDAGIYPHRLVPHVSSLEDVFLELTDDHTGDEPPAGAAGGAHA